MEGTGTVMGKRAPDFSLADAEGASHTLSDYCKKGPVLVAFYPGDFTLVCTKQLCSYRDNLEKFNKYGVQVLGISHNSPAQHEKFGAKYHFPFPLLTDPSNEVAKSFGCTSAWMLNRVSRAVFIVNSKQIILYRYVEPTVLTHRSADEIVDILGDLRGAKLI